MTPLLVKYLEGVDGLFGEFYFALRLTRSGFRSVRLSCRLVASGSASDAVFGDERKSDWLSDAGLLNRTAVFGFGFRIGARARAVLSQSRHWSNPAA